MADLSKQMAEAVTCLIQHEGYSSYREAYSDAEQAVTAMLRILVEKAFPHGYDRDDYEYACEELACDAVDTLRALTGEAPSA